ncbi:MAG: phage head closure protein [Pseudomonadota bacterium]
MRAGDLDRTVTIERYQEFANAFNEQEKVWSVLAGNVPAKQKPNRGSERFSARQMTGGAVLTLHMRYRDDIRLQDRILYDGKYWGIQDIRELGRRRVTEVDLIEWSNQSV